MLITIDDSSPQFVYRSKLSSDWGTNHSSYVNYYDQTFHGTTAEGATVSLTFNGSSIRVYGSNWGNHGVYGARIDKQAQQTFSGNSADRKFQTVLYYAGDLSLDEEHTVVMTNLPSQSSPPNGTWWFDIDFVVIDDGQSDKVYTSVFDDVAPNFKYSIGGGWFAPNVSLDGYFDRTKHQSGSAGDQVDIEFFGSSAQVFAGINVDHGNYSVSLDGGPSVELNGTWYDLQTQATIYTVMGLEDTNHTLTFTNLGIGYLSQFDMDYMIVNSTTDPDAIPSTPASTPSSGTTAASGAQGDSSSSSVGAIAGGAVGGVVALALLCGLAWWFFRRRPHRASSAHHVDLNGSPTYGGEEVKPFSYQQTSGTASVDPSPQSTPYEDPFAQAGYSDSALASSNGEQAREPDQTSVPFLSRVPPPPASTASSYARTVNRTAASASGRISEMGASTYSPSELGGLAAIGEHFVNATTASAPASSASSRSGQSRTAPSRGNTAPSPQPQPLRLVTPIEMHRMGAGTVSSEDTLQSSTLYSSPTSTMPRNEKSAAVFLPYTTHSRRSSSPTTTLSPSEMSNNRVDLARTQQDGPDAIAEEPEHHMDLDQPPPPDYHQATRPRQDQLPPRSAAATPDVPHTP